MASNEPNNTSADVRVTESPKEGENHRARQCSERNVVDKTLLNKLFLFIMATRSRIGLRLAGDAILSVYHHWDGYPKWLGVHLVKNYTTKDQIAELLDGGDISCLDSDTDWNLEKVENHVQYYNDRGEKTEPRFDSTV